ncbi:mitochondrial fission factor isoform X8 [Equus asinus]|uniref:mitochondrial fission factor isoform X8 n=1 Tax=Equus asinus TaxID=9793 RepID=UPI0038F6A21F
MSPYRRRAAPAAVRAPHVRPSSRHVTTNLRQLRLLAGASPSRSRVSPGPLRAAPAGALAGRLHALRQRPLRAPTRAPRESAGGGSRRGPSSGPRGNNEDIPFSRPADLDLIQATPFKPLALKTPPRVLTLSERPLDFLDLERPPPTPQNEEIRAVGRLKRERSMSENAVRQNGQLVRTDSIVTPSPPQVRVCPPHMLPEDGANLSSARGILSLIQSSTRRAYQQILDVLDENRRPVLRGGSAAATSNPHHDNVRYGISNADTTLEATSDDMTVVDAASLRRQIIKLNRRLQLLEEENKERAKREMVMYSITVAFWLLNSWLWFRR